MLLLVEGGQQHIHVRECIVNRHLGFECQAKIVALAPLRELLVEWDRHDIDFVAQRFEKPSQDVCAIARADDLHRYFQRQFDIDQFRPFLAITR
jgi:hypothetical protein